MPTHPANRSALGASGFAGCFPAGNPSPDCCAGVDPFKPRLRRSSSRPSPSARVPGIAVRRTFAGVISSEERSKAMTPTPPAQTNRSGARIGPGTRVAAMADMVSRENRAQAVPRLLLTREESARSLGMSLRHFQRHVQPRLPCVYSGQLRLYRPRDLERWAGSAAITREVG